MATDRFGRTSYLIARALGDREFVLGYINARLAALYRGTVSRDAKSFMEVAQEGILRKDSHLSTRGLAGEAFLAEKRLALVRQMLGLWGVVGTARKVDAWQWWHLVGRRCVAG